jgi:hypothetical protein
MKHNIFLSIGIVLAAMSLFAGCARNGPEKPEPYEYTHTTKLEKFEIYETERLRDAERLLVTTLEQLGYGVLTINEEEEAETSPIEFILPDDATQGPYNWYLVNFHFLVEFEEDTGGGFCNVRARPVASIQFETLRVNDSPYIRINGQDAASTSTRIEVRYYNYLSLSSVHPGKNEINFAYKEYQGARVKSVTVYNDTAIEVTGMPPSVTDEEIKVSVEKQERARQIAFGDPRVQELVKDKQYAIRIIRADGILRPLGEPPDDDIEMRLVFARNYMIEDIEATGLDIFIDADEGVVTYFFPLGLNGMPELTASVREKAVEIALADTRVQRELTGKPYTVGKVGITVGGPVGRLGANVLFAFETPYPLGRPAPSAPDRQLTGVKAFVNLKEGKVAQVIEESAPVPSLVNRQEPPAV